MKELMPVKWTDVPYLYADFFFTVYPQNNCDQHDIELHLKRKIPPKMFACRPNASPLTSQSNTHTHIYLPKEHTQAS